MEENTQELLLRFLDEDNFDKKYDILCKFGEEDITDLAIDNMAASLDFVIGDGPIEDRYDQLKVCLRTRARYESLRLR